MNDILRRFSAPAFGITAFIIAWSLGTALTAGTGIPLLGGLFNGVLVSMIFTIGLLSIDKPGTATIMWIVFSLPATLTTTLGPPGPYKIIIGALAGIIWDSVYFGTGKRLFGLYLGAILGALSIIGTLIFALKLGFGENALQALAKYMKALYAILSINLIVTAIGVFLGRQSYVGRLSKLQLFQDLKQSKENYKNFGNLS